MPFTCVDIIIIRTKGYLFAWVALLEYILPHAKASALDLEDRRVSPFLHFDGPINTGPNASH